MRSLLLFFFLLLPSVHHALSLKADAPGRYVVQPGDSLWSIANQYLTNPWEWKLLWRANPQINNPNKLYPGAVLILNREQNTPYIQVLSNGTVKISPNVRVSNADKAIPPIPLAEIKAFLNESLVLDEDVLSHAPYIVAYADDHMVAGPGNQVYVKGLHPSLIMPRGETIAYSIFRSGITYADPVTKESLGYKSKFVGEGELVAGGDPATVLLTDINSGVKILDKVLINNSPSFDFSFEPGTPSVIIAGGYIIDIPDDLPLGHSQGALGTVVVINKGERSGLKAGDVLGIYHKKRVVKDPKNHLIPIKLPRERIGEVMIFRTFTKTSFGIIVRAIRPVYRLDTVANP